MNGPSGAPSGGPERSMGQIVRIVIAAVTVGLVVASGAQAALGHRDIAILLALAAPLGISSWGFARGGHHEEAVVLLCGVLVTVTTMILYLSPLGVHDLAVKIYTGVLFFAAVLLARPAFLMLVALTLGSGAMIFVLELQGMTHSKLGGLTGWTALVDFLLINGVACALARAVAEILFGKLGEAQRARLSDAATGLANREQFLVLAAERLRRVHPAPGFGVLAIADLDSFRRVNHVVGHAAADRILVEAAARVARLGSGEVAGRIGDDEFALLVVGLPDAAAAEALAGKLGEALRFEYAGVSVRASVGHSCYPADAQGIDGLLLAADNALTQAKAGGGR